MNIQSLRNDGFEGDELIRYRNQITDDLKRFGATDEEIDKYLGITRMDPTVFKERAQQYFQQDEEQGLWDSIMSKFKRKSWEKERARSAVSMTLAKESGVAPHVFEPSAKEAIQEGWNQSTTGLIYNGKIPDHRPPKYYEHMSTADRMLMQGTQMLSDIPLFMAGALIGGAGGGGNPATAAGGAFALPAGLRKLYVDMYENGEIETFGEFWKRVSSVGLETVKGYALGVATQYFGGKVPKAAQIPAEVATLTGLGAALEGHVPTMQDFWDTAVLLGGFKSAKLVSGRLRRMYRDQGIDPRVIYQAALDEPAFHEDIISQNYELRFDPVKGERRKVKSDPNVEIDEGKIVRRSDIVKIFRDKLGDMIKTGRVPRMGPQSKSGLMGVFYIKPEHIRLRFANDIETLVHEHGHKLHKMIWSTPGKNLSIKELVPHIDELMPLASSGHPLVEGFAEFFRLYLTQADKAKQAAPNFYTAFENKLQTDHPDLLSIFMDVREQFTAWADQPWRQRILSQVRMNPFREEVNISNFLHTAYRKAFDQFHDLKRVEDDLASGKLAAEDSPYTLARLFKGVGGKALHFLEKSPFKFSDHTNFGKSLKDIIGPLTDKKSIEDFTVYALSKRHLEKIKQRVETGILTEDAEIAVRKYGPKYERMFREINDYQNSLLMYLRDSGMLSQEAFINIKELNKDFIPFHRVYEGKFQSALSKGLEPHEALKKMVGSWREIDNPLETIVKNTYAYIIMAEKNAVVNSLVKLAENQHGSGSWIRRVPPALQKIMVEGKELGFPKELKEALQDEYGVNIDEAVFDIFRSSAFEPKDVITVFRNGKKTFYEAEPELLNVVKGLSNESMNWLVRLLSYPSSWLRAGVTASPEFVARNPIKDQFTAFINTKFGFVPGYHLMRGFFDMASFSKETGLKRSDLYWEWTKEGGQQSVLVSMDKDYMHKELKDLLRTPVRNLVKTPLDYLRLFSKITEEATRVEEFRLGLNKLGTSKSARMDAALASREISIDFQRKGDSTTTKALSQLIAFFNPSLQGTDKMIRQLVTNPDPKARNIALLKAAASITIPSIALYLHNRKDPRFKEIPQWQKYLFWIVMTEDEIYRIPKPFETGIIFGSMFEWASDFILNKDPKAFDKFSQTMSRGMLPGMIPTAVLPIVEGYANRSTFLDRPIIGAEDEKVLPQYQYKPYTTETAKALGKVIGKVPVVGDMQMFTSPPMIENWIRDWFGGLGAYALEIADYGLKKAGLVPDRIKPKRTIADLPFVRGFAVRWPTVNAESITNFYDNHKKATQWNNTAKKMIKTLEIDEYMRVNEASPYMTQMAGIYDELGNMSRLIQMIDYNPQITPDEKRALIDKVIINMVMTARAGNEAYETIKKLSRRKK